MKRGNRRENVKVSDCKLNPQSGTCEFNSRKDLKPPKPSKLWVKSRKRKTKFLFIQFEKVKYEESFCIWKVLTIKPLCRARVYLEILKIIILK